MITENTTVVGVEPRDMTAASFRAIQAAAQSPAADAAQAAYDAIVAHGVSVAFLLAVFHAESQFATDPRAIVLSHNTHNPGNCRSSRTGVGEIIDTPRGQFVRYPDWVSGWDDLAFRLVDPAFVYVQEGRRSIRQIIERFAPAEDDNIPTEYIAAVVANMNRWVEASPLPASDIVDGVVITRGFLDLWRDIAPNVRDVVLGPPLRAEIDTRGTALETEHGIQSAQPFQRGWLIFQPRERPRITVADKRLWRDLEPLL